MNSPLPMPLIVHVGDHVIMRKPHPCGSSEWIVTRVGTDIGLRCVGCDRRVMLVRSEFNKRVKKIVCVIQSTDPTSSEPPQNDTSHEGETMS